MPKRVECRGAIGRFCHAFVRGCRLLSTGILTPSYLSFQYSLFLIRWVHGFGIFSLLLKHQRNETLGAPHIFYIRLTDVVDQCLLLYPNPIEVAEEYAEE